MNDFIGFAFNGIHSSDLNILRVSNGSRYSENLLPQFEDKTISVDGQIGQYYFGSVDKTKRFVVPFAFDSLTETKIRELRNFFNNKNICPLIFDETPYKAYSAKVASPPTLNYICFDEGGQRIYKGEGSVEFICYYPYAKAIAKSLDELPEYSNFNEWKDSCGMPQSIDPLNFTSTKKQVEINNCGDVEMDWAGWLSISNIQDSPAGVTVNIDNQRLVISGDLVAKLNKSNVYDTHIKINSKTNLLEGYNYENGFVPSGNLYNQYIKEGDFFKIPLGTHNLQTNATDGWKELDYTYLYY